MSTHSDAVGRSPATTEQVQAAVASYERTLRLVKAAAAARAERQQPAQQL